MLVAGEIIFTVIISTRWLYYRLLAAFTMHMYMLASPGQRHHAPTARQMISDLRK